MYQVKVNFDHKDGTPDNLEFDCDNLCEVAEMAFEEVIEKRNGEIIQIDIQGKGLRLKVK